MSRYRRAALAGAVLGLLLFASQAGAVVTFVRAWGSENGPGHLVSPYAIAFSPSGFVYVTDAGNNRVVKFTRFGEYVTSWGTFPYPMGIAVDAQHRVLVVDYYNHQVAMFDSAGGFIRNLAGPANLGGYVRQLLITADGRVHVPHTAQVSVFDSLGTPVGTWAQGMLAADPSAIAQDPQGNFYIVEESNRLTKWDPNFVHVGTWGAPGSEPGQFNGPVGIAVGQDSRVYVSSHNNARVDVFLADGSYLESWGTEWADLGRLYTPAGVAVDDSGLVYVCDLYSNLISVYDPGLGPANLAPVSPSGWVGPIVPRALADASQGSVPAPATLWGDTLQTFINWAVVSSVPAPTTWPYAVTLDGEPLFSESLAGSGVLTGLNRGPLAVRGGWHTLSGIADPSGLVTETFETDNRTDSQWLWAPRAIARGSGLHRQAPPRAGTGVHRNCDAVKFVRDVRYGWLAAAVPDSIGDTYELVCFNDYLDAQHGLQNNVGQVRLAGQATKFIVGSFLSSGSAIYPALSDSVDNGPRAGCLLFADDSRSRQADSPTASWPDEQLAPTQLGRLYEGYFEAGGHYHIELARLGGAGELAFEVFGPDAGLIQATGMGTPGIPVGDGQVDTLEFTPSETGWHQLVVSRTAGAGSDASLYGFAWQLDGNILGIDSPLVPPAHELRGPLPNPVRGQCRFDVRLPRPETVELSIYDISGRSRVTVWQGALPAGRSELSWDSGRTGRGDLGSGIYWARLRGEGWEVRRRLVLIR